MCMSRTDKEMLVFLLICEAKPGTPLMFLETTFSNESLFKKIAQTSCEYLRLTVNFKCYATKTKLHLFIMKSTLSY